VTRAWRAVAFVWGTLSAASLAYFVVRVPMQVTDSLANLLGAREQSWWTAMAGGVGGGYVRPLLGGELKLVDAFAAGRETVVYRGLHGFELVACVLLFVSAVRVRDAASALAVPLGVAMLLGAHTFDGTVREAFPINNYLTVVVACLLAVNLSHGEPRRWRDVTAVALVVATMLTVESGILVLVCLAVAWLTGARGVSRGAVLAAGVVALALIGGRFLLPGGGTPALSERPSGFGFGRLEPQELQARFGAFPYFFYAYNVVCQALSVLFAEPSAGTWAFIRDLLAGSLRPARLVAVASATGATVLVVWFCASRWSVWRSRAFEHDDRLVLVAAAAVAVNAALSFPYTKDVIMSAAGALYALAATVAAAALLRRLAVARPPLVFAVSVLLMVLSAGWSIRLLAVHYRVRDAAFVTRNEWTELDAWAARNRVDLSSPTRATLARRLRDDALDRRVPSPSVNEHGEGRTLVRYFE